ncbi:MAG TPA: hypothetical protein VGP30_03150 [Candidatus Limnocylindrales bacterium]|nr:hypothetical protein [Candidatus Limnocylindrales bacterium]
MNAGKTRRRGGRLKRLGRTLGSAGLTAGMARGVTGRRSRDDTFLARSAMLSEMGRLHDRDGDHSAGLLDRLPGWLILAVGAVVLVVTIVIWRWQ